MIILNEKYNLETFAAFLTDFLPNDYREEEKDLSREAEKCKKIIKAKELGYSKSLDVYVLEMTHTSNSDPRVTITAEAFKLLAAYGIDKALVVFKSENSDNWRLSYMTITLDIDEKSKITKSFSNPRRKSFFLGPDARIATPKKYLSKNRPVKTIKELEACFDVEVVTNEFFENYRKLFVKLSEHLQKDKEFAVFVGNNSIKIEDFAKKLLGQIVFIYFLQKKGWLGARKEQHVYEGDSAFLRNLFSKCQKENNNFFNDFLEPLFYDAFNNEPERAGNFYREYFDCQIPFLNGGLFEPLNKYDWKKSFLHIPNELFSNTDGTGILDIFDLYNFTIDENSPIDQEVSVDPEMLGKVFEKLLVTNKKTGSFYTPRDIVSYMVKQSLIEYLKTKTDVKESAIEELVNNHQANEDELNKQDYAAIEKALKEIKIIDPAVGSGAFPVGILQEMTSIRQICQSHTLAKPMLAYDIKREILENNIYGVDIDHGAIDIARLRFWLSLVVDADLMDVEPLPNLDFKLVAANTLLKLDGEAGLYDEKDLLDKMKELREKYFRARTKTSKEKIQSDYKKLICRSNHMFATDRQRLITTYDPFSPSLVAQFFDPEFMFGIKSFDIVIANPPYISYYSKNQNIAYKIRDSLNKMKLQYDFILDKKKKGRYNSMSFFIERGLKMLSKNSTLIFIVDISLHEKASIDIRKYINDKFRLLEVVYNLSVFENVTSDQSIIAISNNESKEGFKWKADFFNQSLYYSRDAIDKENGYSLYFSPFEQILKKIEEYEPLSYYMDHAVGVQIGGKNLDYQGKRIESLFIYPEQKDGLNLIQNIVSIERYGKPAVKGYINFDINLGAKVNKEIRDANIALPNNEPFINSVKIILRQSSSVLTATLGDIGSICEHKFFVFKNKNKSPLGIKYILALINSRLLTFYALEKNIIKHGNKKQPQIRIKEFIKIPIAGADERGQNKIISMVDKIIKITSSENYNLENIPPEKKLLEADIDRMVYDVYGLTDEEIKVIESNVK